MKLDLDSISKRFCGAGMLALVAEQLFPDYMPAWLGWYWPLAILVGLCFMLAHEVVSRRRVQRAAKLGVQAL